MPAEDLEVIDSCLRVVSLLSTLSNDLCNLLVKINNAPPEIDDLLYHTRGLGALINETARLLRARKEDREKNAGATPNELAAENWLHTVMYECQIRLREMKRIFIPLQYEEVSATQRQDTLGFDSDSDFFKKQQDEIESQHRKISLALQMLEFHRSRGDRARVESDGSHSAQPEQLLQKCRTQTPESPPRSPVPSGDQTADGEMAPIQSGETGMPDTDDDRDIGSGAGDDPIDVSIPGNEEAILGVTGAPSSEADHSGDLMKEVRMRNIDEVRKLLGTSPPEEIHVLDDNKWTLLHHAVLQGDVPILKLLLQQPEIRDPEYLNAKNSSGHTALMDACKRADQERGSKLAHLLLELEQCDVNVKDGSAQQRSALYFVVDRTANKYSKSVAEALMDKGADIRPIAVGLSHKKGYAVVNKAVESFNKGVKIDEKGHSRGRIRINSMSRR